MRATRIGLAVTGMLFAAIAVVVVLLFTMDLGRFKPQVETLVSDLLDRRTQIDGLFQPSLGAEIRIIAEDLWIENPDWATRESLIQVHRLDVSIDTWELLSGRILLTNLEVDDIVIGLEQDKAGLNNWTLFKPSEEEEEEATDDAKSTLDLLIQHARVRELTITYVEPSQDAPIQFHASAIDQVELESGDLQLELDGDINGTPVSLDATAGSFANLLAAGQVHYNLRGFIGEISIESDAQIDNLAAPRKPVGQLKISGPNAQYLTDVLGIAPITQGPLNLVATIEPVADKMNLKIQGEYGEFKVNAVGSFSDLQDLNEANINFSATGPDAATFGELTGLDGIPAEPYSINGTVYRAGDLVSVETVSVKIGETEFDLNATIAEFPDVDGAVVSLQIDGPELSHFNKLLGLPGKLTGPFNLTADLSQTSAGEELVDISAQTRDIQFRVNGRVSTAPDFIGTELALNVTGDDLSVVTDALDIKDVPGMPFDVNASLSRNEHGITINKGIANLGAREEYRLELDGLLTDPPEFNGSRMTISAHGASLQQIAGIAEISGLPEASFRVSGTVDRLKQGFSVKDGEVQVAQDRLHIEGLIGNAPLEQDTDLRFRVFGPDLAQTLNMAGVELEAVPPGSYEAAGQIQRKAEYFKLDDITVQLGTTRAQLDGRLGNLTDFQGTDIDITLDGENLAKLVPEVSGYVFKEVPFNVASNIQVTRDVLKLGKLKVDVGAGKLRGDISIAMSPMLASGSVEVTAQGPDVAEWIPKFAQYIPVTAPFDLTGGVHWKDSHVTVDRLDLKLAKSHLVANGTVNGDDFSRTDLNIDAQVASMSNLGRIAGTNLPDEPLTLSAHLIGSADMLRLENLVATAGKSDLAGSATYKTQGEIPFIDLSLNSKYLNLVPLLPRDTDGAASEPAPPADNSRVIPDTPIPMELLLKQNAQLDISIGELVLRETTVNDVLLVGSLQAGALRIDKFGVAGQRGTLAGTLELLPSAGKPRISAAVDGAGVTLGLRPSSPDAVHLLPHYDFQLKLAAAGATVREMAASLDGTLRLVSGSGQSKGLPGWFMRDVIAEVVDTVNPFHKKEDFMRIQCFAILLRSVAGQVDGQPAIVMQTDKLNIISVAFVDLATEEIDVKFETAARTGIGIGAADFVTPYTKISGTMAKPQLTFDAEEAAARGAQTVATLGTSWIAKKVKGRFFADKDPCGTSVAEADEEMRGNNAD